MAIVFQLPSVKAIAIAVLFGLAACTSSLPLTIHVFDLSYTNGLSAADRFEHVHTVSAIAGLANRKGPRLFTPLLVDGGSVDSGSNADDMWRKHLMQPGEWLASATWKNISSLEELVEIFADVIGAGVVLYDPSIPATSNLASTAAGVEGLVPVCNRPDQKGSLFDRLIAGGPRLPVRLHLSSLTIPAVAGSKKVGAYKWARERWLSPNSVRKANPAKLGYYADYWAALQGDRLHAAPGLTEVSNHDYFIAHGAFFFDLSIWADETPVDDPNQELGADRAELIAIFAACYNLTQDPNYTGPEMLHVGGFTPWWFKYTSEGSGCPNCKHKGVETEWETMGVIGAYNAFDDSDACCVGAMANSAFYQHYPLPSSLKQNRKPALSDLQKRGLVDSNGKVKPAPYAAYYAGDYDGAAWLYNQLRPKWDDPKRGSVPIGWAIDSELSMRFPVIYKYLYQTKTPNDFFISGDSGAGYVNPTLLIPDPKTGRRGDSPITKSGVTAWVKWNTHWYQKFDLSFTGFLINGNQGQLTNESIAIYDSFSPDGVVVTTGNDPVHSNIKGAAWIDAAGTPVLHHVTDMPGDVKTAAEQIADMIHADQNITSGQPTFYFLRNILQSAGYMVDVAAASKALVPDIEFVDPYTMGLLVKVANGVVPSNAESAEFV